MKSWVFALTALAAWGSAGSAQTAVAAVPEARLRPLGRDDIGVQYIDEGSLSTDGTSREFSLFVVFAHPPVSDDGKTRYPYGTFRTRIDCAAWTVKALSATFHAKDGVDYQAPFGDAPAPIRPGTAVETTANYACKGKLDPAFAQARLVTEQEAIRGAQGGIAKVRDRGDAGGK